MEQSTRLIQLKTMKIKLMMTLTGNLSK